MGNDLKNKKHQLLNWRRGQRWQNIYLGKEAYLAFYVPKILVIG
jgi:hypothetical protein